MSSFGSRHLTDPDLRSAGRVGESESFSAALLDFHCRPLHALCLQVFKSK